MKESVQKRCAIYTRKSSEEGLDQSYNSLAAQRDACSAYIASQVGEGWKEIADAFDDGGYSGGSMDRPALSRLLAEIDAGHIDIVVVYKVDPLTRSLADFARIVERLEAKDASFVSVTQAFNTTTSMGRLTLNVLLSFAQFEREVTGERIRDKIAASKRKGMWMGGRPMLGYRPNGRTLDVDPEEAETVRDIFKRYLELGSVYALRADLTARKVHGKTWMTKSGKVMGGGVLALGALYNLLRNRHYRGLIPHKKDSHVGLHEAIIDADLFEAVQRRLDGQSAQRRARPLLPGGAPLTGLLFDDAGNLMSPSHARGKAGKRHRYYVSTALIAGDRAKAGARPRVPALAIETLVEERISRLPALAPFSWATARAQIDRVTVSESTIAIALKTAVSASAARELLPVDDQCDATPEGIVIKAAARLGRRAGRTHLLDPNGRRADAAATPDPVLVRALGQGWRWRMMLLSGAYPGSDALARAESVARSHLQRMVRLAYLAPDIQEDILAGRHRPGLSIDVLTRHGAPMDWSAQRRLYKAH
ncbi:MAG: recombinase family protein [Alphaproteobacteria bacterium]|nr:recombinase family protein [Alphaproteobacteria bacterium]